MQIRLKHNMPDAPLRFSKTFGALKYLGSNVQDGSFGSGGSARTITRKFGSRPGQKTDVGWIKQDIIPVDRTTQPKYAALGPYTWNNKRAQVFRAKISGQAFLPSPMGYDKSLLQGRNTRGNQVPRVVLTESGSAPTGESLNYKVSPMSGDTPPQGAPTIAQRRGVPTIAQRRGVPLIQINTQSLF
jgi:hypothetical protein